MTDLLLLGASTASLVVWLYLVFLRGWFWRAGIRLDDHRPEPAAWPEVVAIVPARNESEVIGRSLASLIGQDYPGRLEIVLADDDSGDGTAQVAARRAQDLGQGARLHVTAARPTPAGWTGKLWALAEGLSRATAVAPQAKYLWLSDADIEHDPGNLRTLVAKAEAAGLDLVSWMVALSCRGAWERLLIPPFVYFFQMLYPFSWVADPTRRCAAAAGGCVLLRRAALARAGGFAAIKGELIDDCALAGLIKDLGSGSGPGTDPGTDPESGPGGGIWLGLTTAARSIRPYQGLGAIWRMVARCAYTQLGHSPLRLAVAILGLLATYLIPPALVLAAPWHGQAWAALSALAAWLLMAISFRPTLAFYGQPVGLALLLPLAATFYGAMTLDSALAHWRGRGGAWKGRVHPAAGKVEQ